LYNKTPKAKDVVIKLNGKLMQKFINHIGNNNDSLVENQNLITQRREITQG
jgi:hypothetical protein